MWREAPRPERDSLRAAEELVDELGWEVVAQDAVVDSRSR
jgi:hypothetical protein